MRSCIREFTVLVHMAGRSRWVLVVGWHGFSLGLSVSRSALFGLFNVPSLEEIQIKKR